MRPLLRELVYEGMRPKFGDNQFIMYNRLIEKLIGAKDIVMNDPAYENIKWEYEEFLQQSAVPLTQESFSEVVD